jgi:predicted  nucleic acid-binding Zn-ribbon protein
MNTFDHESHPDALAVLRDLLALLTHPKAARELIDELSAATARHGEAAVAAAQAMRALAAEREEHGAKLAQALSDHRYQVAEERQQLNSEINRRRAEVTAQEKAVAATKATAETDARQAVELRARWQKKIDMVDAGLRA